MTSSRKQVPLVMCFLTIVLVLTVFISPFYGTAHAAAAHTLQPLTHCWEGQCNGSDPYNDGCAGSGASYKVLLSSYIYDDYNNRIGYLQLWYSATCDTNWARTVSTVGNVSVLAAEIGDQTHYTPGNPLNSRACYNCSDYRSYQYYIPGPANAYGSIEDVYNTYVHQ